MLAPFLFTNILIGMEINKEFNSRHSMLEFSLFMAVPSADYYLPTKDKYQTFYVSSSCIFTSLTVNDTIE